MLFIPFVVKDKKGNLAKVIGTHDGYLIVIHGKDKIWFARQSDIADSYKFVKLLR